MTVEQHEWHRRIDTGEHSSVALFGRIGELARRGWFISAAKHDGYWYGEAELKGEPVSDHVWVVGGDWESALALVVDQIEAQL